MSEIIYFRGGYSFCRAMLCISAAYVVMRCVCVCVCLSVTFVDHVKTNKYIFEIFSPSGSHIILVFPYQTTWQYSDGDPSNGGVKCRWVMQKRDSGRIYGFAAYRSTVLSTVRVANCEKQSRDGRCRASIHHGVRLRCSHKTTTKCLRRARRYTP